MRKQSYFTCQLCGSEHETKEKSTHDRKSGVDRCFSCYDIWHKANIIKKAKDKQASFEDLQKRQEAERHAKAVKDVEDLLSGAKTQEQVCQSSDPTRGKLKIKEGLDKFYYDLELRMINEGLE